MEQLTNPKLHETTDQETGMVVEERNDSMCYLGSDIMPNEVIAD